MIKNKSNNIIANHIISDLVSRIKNRALSPNNNVFEVIYSKDTKYILDLLKCRIILIYSKISKW